MNEIELRRSWTAGMMAMGLIPVLQLCYLSYYAHFLNEIGIRPIEVMSRPPMSIFVWHPAIALVGAAFIAAWVLVLILGKPRGIVHVTICQVFSLIMALHLTLVVLRTSSLAATILVIRSQNEQRTQNQASDATSEPAPSAASSAHQRQHQ